MNLTINIIFDHFKTSYDWESIYSQLVSYKFNSSIKFDQ